MKVEKGALNGLHQPISDLRSRGNRGGRASAHVHMGTPAGIGFFECSCPLLVHLDIAVSKASWMIVTWFSWDRGLLSTPAPPPPPPGAFSSPRAYFSHTGEAQGRVPRLVQGSSVRHRSSSCLADSLLHDQQQELCPYGPRWLLRLQTSHVSFHGGVVWVLGTQGPGFFSHSL